MTQNSSNIFPLPWFKFLVAILPCLVIVSTLSNVWPLMGWDSGDRWAAILLIIVISAAVLTIGTFWKRGISVWSLPALGVTVAGLIGVFGHIGLAIIAGAVLVLIVLIWFSIGRSGDLRAVWIILLSMIGLILAQGAIILFISGELQGVWDSKIIVYHIISDLSSGLPVMGVALLLVASGLPFAWRLGSMAALISCIVMSYVLFFFFSFDNPALASGGQGLQAVMPVVFSALGMLVTPLLIFRSHIVRSGPYVSLAPSIVAAFSGVVIEGSFSQASWWEWLAMVTVASQLVLGLVLAYVLYDQLGLDIANRMPGKEASDNPGILGSSALW